MDSQTFVSRVLGSILGRCQLPQNSFVPEQQYPNITFYYLLRYIFENEITNATPLMQQFFNELNDTQLNSTTEIMKRFTTEEQTEQICNLIIDINNPQLFTKFIEPNFTNVYHYTSFNAMHYMVQIINGGSVYGSYHLQMILDVLTTEDTTDEMVNAAIHGWNIWCNNFTNMFKTSWTFNPEVSAAFDYELIANIINCLHPTNINNKWISNNETTGWENFIKQITEMNHFCLLSNIYELITHNGVKQLFNEITFNTIIENDWAEEKSYTIIFADGAHTFIEVSGLQKYLKTHKCWINKKLFKELIQKCKPPIKTIVKMEYTGKMQWDTPKQNLFKLINQNFNYNFSWDKYTNIPHPCLSSFPYQCPP